MCFFVRGCEFNFEIELIEVCFVVSGEGVVDFISEVVLYGDVVLRLLGVG